MTNIVSVSSTDTRMYRDTEMNGGGEKEEEGGTKEGRTKGGRTGRRGRERLVFGDVRCLPACKWLLCFDN